MSINSLTEDTVIEISKSIPISKFRDFFVKATGKELSGWEFQPWLNMQVGKTLKETIAVYCEAIERKNMEKILLEDRFNIVSGSDKIFITAFDKEIGHLGYSFGGGIGDGYCWGKYMVVYTKANVKSKNVVARIFIREDCIVLRLFVNNVDKHRAFIENAPTHIKDVFIGNQGTCSCNPKKENCHMRKTYTIDGKTIEKCSGVVFEFWNPPIEKLPDYIDLLKEFYTPPTIKHKSKP